MAYYLTRRKLPTDIDYKEVGLMSGVEIHHQILTDKKMFCHCPSRKFSEEYHTSVLRHMRPTMSEMGEYDGTALMEFKKKKEIVYLVNKNNTCTYELDDTPPFLVNEQGLDIAIEVSLMLGCSIVDEFHITRKQYLDGSIPTGFQRTGIVGVGGGLHVDGKLIRILQLSYEEDSCREVSDVGHRITFRPDRLGMPLIEAVTLPDMVHPYQVARVVEEIGRLMRVTGKVRRGYGSVRQDVNVSVRGGTRVEIKGVPKIPFIPMLVHIEAVRQHTLLNIKAELHSRGFTTFESIIGEDKEVTPLFKDTNNHILSSAMARGEKIRAIVLRGVAGIAEWQTQPDRVFLDEVKGRLRVVACLDEKPHCMSTIDFTDHGITQQTIDDLHREMGATDKDTVFIVWGNERDSKLGCSEIHLRFKEAVMGVPGETRQHFPDGHTDFERILPGPERMYPDTDHPPIQIKRNHVNDIQDNLASAPWLREAELKKQGLSEDVVYHLAISKRYELHDRIVNELKVNPKLSGEILDRKMRALHREGAEVLAVSDSLIYDLFQMHSEHKLASEGIEKAIKFSAENPELCAIDVVKNAGLTPVSKVQAAVVVKQAKEEALAENMTGCEKVVRSVMGRAMHHLRGVYEGTEVFNILKANCKCYD